MVHYLSARGGKSAKGGEGGGRGAAEFWERGEMGWYEQAADG